MECNRDDIYGAMTTHQALLHLTFLLVLPHFILAANFSAAYLVIPILPSKNRNSAWKMGRSGIQNTDNPCEENLCNIGECGLCVCSRIYIKLWGIVDKCI